MVFKRKVCASSPEGWPIPETTPPKEGCHRFSHCHQSARKSAGIGEGECGPSVLRGQKAVGAQLPLICRSPRMVARDRGLGRAEGRSQDTENSPPAFNVAPRATNLGVWVYSVQIIVVRGRSHARAHHPA